MSVHRRTLLKGLASLPLATILGDTLIARAVAATTDSVEITTADGDTIRGALALPEAQRAPAVLLIHEWWGLNDQIKSMAVEFAREGYVALALDLYDGDVATNSSQAMRYLNRVADSPLEARRKVIAWTNWLREHERSTGKVGVVGWCFGGGWALNTAIAAEVDATVIYYGNVNRPVTQLERVNSPILGHFGTQDQRINREMVGTFEERLERAGHEDHTFYWYDANHAFANPSGGRYDEEAARLSWRRTLEFFSKHLREE